MIQPLAFNISPKYVNFTLKNSLLNLFIFLHFYYHYHTSLSHYCDYCKQSLYSSLVLYHNITDKAVIKSLPLPGVKHFIIFHCLRKKIHYNVAYKRSINLGYCLPLVLYMLLFSSLLCFNHAELVHLLRNGKTIPASSPLDAILSSLCLLGSFSF